MRFDELKTVQSLQFTVQSLQFTIYNLQFTVNSLQYKVHSLQLTLTVLPKLKLKNAINKVQFRFRLVKFLVIEKYFQHLGPSLYL
jgi:hypothetical protein